MKLCIIDIGTNSIHSVFAEIDAVGAFHVIGKNREMVRLGDKTVVTGLLSNKAMASAMEALRRFVHVARHRGVTRIMAVATSAVREAQNGGAFLDRVRAEIGIKVQVITGLEEARLIFLAVQKTVNFYGKKALVVDIGGGSAEFIFGSQEKSEWLDSLHLGANRLSQIYPLSDPPKKSEIKSLEKHIATILKPIFVKVKKKMPYAIFGTSGTLTALARMVLNKNINGDGDAAARQVMLKYKEIESVYKKLCDLKVNERAGFRGLDKSRADMIVHGVAVIKVLMELAGINQFMACDKALREGMVYDFIEKNRKALKIEGEIPDVRRRGVVSLLEKFPVLKIHSLHTAKLVLTLFDALKKNLKLSASDRDLLEYAALLHDIGYHVSFQRHQKHSYYLIMNSDLDGFSLREQQVIAWVSRYHRRGFEKKESEFLKLPEEIKRRIYSLAAILRIADALDHSHFSLVKSLKVKVSRGLVLIILEASPDSQCEIYEAGQRKDLFEKVYGKRIEFRIRTKK